MPFLAPGITLVPTTSRDNAYLVDGDDGLTLVDVGWASATRPPLAGLDDVGAGPSDIKRIVFTHAHPDHVQGAPQLREHTKASILIHYADADWLPEGRVPPQGRSGTMGKLVDRLPKLHWKPFTADGTLQDSELIQGSGGLAT
jgi:glyoxylase-like metal-dependent hydrolase (beta-lactamase superfamily II)